MKKLFLGVIILSALTFNSYSEIVHRRACMADLEEILGVLNKFNDDDLSKIVVFPIQVRSKILEESIEKGHIYVSVDMEENRIVNMMKVFLIESREEFDGILGDELGFKISGKPAKLVKNVTYQADSKKGLNLKEVGSLLPSDKRPELLNFCAKCAYFYYGSAYTLPEYRGMGINSEMLRYALSEACSRVSFKDSGISYMALLYGQVDANEKNLGMIRVFANFIMQLEKKYFESEHQIRLHHVSAFATKPDFVFDHSGLVPRFLEKNKGTGNIVFS